MEYEVRSPGQAKRDPAEKRVLGVARAQIDERVTLPSLSASARNHKRMQEAYN